MRSTSFVVGDLLTINQHLDIWCQHPGCHRHLRWKAVEAVQRLGRDTPFDTLRDRMRCSACGVRGRQWIDVRPCTLDESAWSARERIARDPGSFNFEQSIELLTRLAGGDLGGDGPIQWPLPCLVPRKP